MSQQRSVEIIDGNGWRKEISLEQNLIHVGSDARNDIVLDTWRGSGVSQRHLQLIAVSGETLRYRAVNLGDTDILMGESGEQVLSPRSSTEIGSGQRLQLGDFVLVFRLGGAAAPAVAPAPVPEAPSSAPAPVVVPAPAPVAFDTDSESDVIGLRLSLPSQMLGPDRPLEGLVAVRNLGDQPGVQFKLELDGFDPDCYEIGPGPILFPNVEKGVFLRLDHPRKPNPPAGRHQIRICATAPEAYPGESAVVSQEIEIVPYYHHTVRLVPVG